VGVFESPLERFKNWGTDLRIWGFLKPNEGDNSKWLYHIVMVEPRATVFHVEKMKNAEMTAKLEFFTSLAKKFYLNAFDANAENTFKIDLSLNRDMTVMLLASKVGNKELQKPIFSCAKTLLSCQLCRIVACVLKQMKSRSSQDPEVLVLFKRLCLWKTLMKGLMSCFLGWQYQTVLLLCRPFLLHGADKGLTSSCSNSSSSSAQHLQKWWQHRHLLAMP
jgi:hypothetical protein